MYLSASCGGSIARYFLSLNMSNEDAGYKQDKSSKYYKGVLYNTYGLRANIDITLTKTTNLYFGVSANKTINNLPGSSDTNAIWQAVSQLNPIVLPMRYSNGKYPAADTSTAGTSPYVLLNYTGMMQKENFSSTYTMNLDQRLDMILKNLKFRVQGAYTTNQYFEESRFIQPEIWFYDKRNTAGELSGTQQKPAAAVTYTKSEYQYRKYFLQADLSWNHTFAEKYNIYSFVHYEMSDSKSTLDLKDTMAAIPVRYQGLSAKVSLNYSDLYMLDGNFGYTGSENFQPGRQFGFFPSVSGAWVPTSYNWVKKEMPWLNYFKIRASYGLVGNDRISTRRFPYLTKLT